VRVDAEELVAEMGTAFLCPVAGIEQVTLENSAAYIDGWRKVIGDDPKLVVQAAARAQKASDFILGRRFESKEAAGSRRKGVLRDSRFANRLRAWYSSPKICSSF